MNKTVLYKTQAERPGVLYWLEGGRVARKQIEGKMELGRKEPDSSKEIQVPSPYVSGSHGSFVRMGGMCLYQDMGSLNGTFLNGERLDPDIPVRLSDGDILRIGNPKAKTDPDNVVLLYSTRGNTDTAWEFYQPDPDVLSFEAGREAAPDALTLTGDDVSRSQCVFHRTVYGWAVENRSRTNVTQLNGREISSAALAEQDVLRMGNSYAIYTGEGFFFQTASRPAPAAKRPAAPPPEPEKVKVPAVPSRTRPAEAPARPRPPVAESGNGLEINILRRRVKTHRTELTLLEDIRLSVMTGEMVLILGGSGAGKTTFMNAVMGYEPAEGTVRLGDSDIYRDFEKMKYEIGYVPQEDLLRRSDYVEETLDNAAKLRLPASVPEERRLQLVEETLVTFGLEPERDKLVGKLSGGQRKRLSIAVEYVGQPSLFFLDEPDSGLDGIMARELLENLRFIADSGKIVMVITHAPDRGIDLFDKVIVLAKSTRDNVGHLAFYGSVDEAKAFFEVNGLEAIVRRINRKDEGGDGLADHYIEKYRRERE